MTEVPDLLEFPYGRLSIDNRYIMQSDNNVNFSLYFDKKIFTPEDDITLTVYVANYTGEVLSYVLEEPIVSRQQLIHASLTYGDGQYSVPVTVAYEPEHDLENGVTEVEVRDRKLLATTVTFHTSAYENIEDSIFNEDFADSYDMRFWFGDDEYTYRAKVPLGYNAIDWTDAASLQTLVLPSSYIRLVGDIRFTVTFDRTEYGTDNDVRMHVKVENVGKAPITLYSGSDISQPSYYIRAEMVYGNQSAVRDNVAGAAEIVGIESSAQLKYQETLERDICFYTSEFTNISRSVYAAANRNQCTLRVWLLVKDQTCEISIPIKYADYAEYSYHDRELPVLTTAPDVTTTEPETTETEPAETTTEPVETTTEPVETTTEPVETTADPVETSTPETETTAPETTTEPATTTGPEVTTTEPETSTEPVETTGLDTTPVPDTTTEPAETTGPEATTVEPETETEPLETTTSAPETVAEPAVTVSPETTTAEPEQETEPEASSEAA